MRYYLSMIVLAGLAACSPATKSSPESATASPNIISAPPKPSYPGEVTKVLSLADAQRLKRNKGLTLQWIDWNSRGTASVVPHGGLWQLRGSQSDASGKGRLFLDGAILEIGDGYFTFRGTIRITDTPDPKRSCELDKTWHFAVTQGRPYYRLREFEWCDGLTDYIDVYF